MIIYKCMVTGDELFSDTFKINEVDDCYEVIGSYIVEKSDDIKIDGANPSAEEAAEMMQSSEKSGLDIVMKMYLVEVACDSKKTLLDWAKSLSKGLLKKWQDDEISKEEIEKKKASILNATKVLAKKFKSFDKFYVGESVNPDGVMGMLEHRVIDGNEVPIMVFIKEAMMSEKV